MHLFARVVFARVGGFFARRRDGRIRSPRILGTPWLPTELANRPFASTLNPLEWQGLQVARLVQPKMAELADRPFARVFLEQMVILQVLSFCGAANVQSASSVVSDRASMATDVRAAGPVRFAMPSTCEKQPQGALRLPPIRPTCSPAVGRIGPGAPAYWRCRQTRRHRPERHSNELSR